MSYFIQHIFR